MSDSRFHLKVQFEIYGQKYEWEPSLNYFNRGDGMDDRIFDFFVKSYEDAYSKFQYANQKAEIEARAAAKEREERELLARLKAKYEDPL